MPSDTRQISHSHMSDVPHTTETDARGLAWKMSNESDTTHPYNWAHTKNTIVKKSLTMGVAK